MTLSNEHGRAMECKFAKEIVDYATSKGIKVTKTPRAILDNRRDNMHWQNIPIPLKEEFEKAAKTFIGWAVRKGWFHEADSLILDRLPDSVGPKGSVTDIVLIFCKGKIELGIYEVSLKNHHNALKHPRLPRLPGQSGIHDKVIINSYVNEHNRIWKSFYDRAIIFSPSTTKFNELKAKDGKFIIKNLYKPLIYHVISFLNKHVNNPSHAETFFRFLVGSNTYYVVKNEPGKIVIKHFDFSRIKMPNGFEIIYPYNGRETTFLIRFDNGWQITSRLHTASKEFFRNGKIHSSSKFDVLCINIDSIIKTENIPK